MTLCGWGVKARMVRVWVAGKTVWSPCYTRAISERFRGAARRSAIQIHVYFTYLLKGRTHSGGYLRLDSDARSPDVVLYGLKAVSSHCNTPSDLLLTVTVVGACAEKKRAFAQEIVSRKTMRKTELQISRRNCLLYWILFTRYTTVF